MSKSSKTETLLETAGNVAYIFDDLNPYQCKFAWMVKLGDDYFWINDYVGMRKILNPELTTAKAGTVDQFWQAVIRHQWPTIRVYRNGNYHAHLATWPQIASETERDSLPAFVQFDEETGNPLRAYNHEGLEAALKKKVAWGKEQASSYINK